MLYLVKCAYRPILAEFYMDAHRMYVCAGGGEGPRSGAQSSGLEKNPFTLSTIHNSCPDISHRHRDVFIYKTLLSSNL